MDSDRMIIDYRVWCAFRGEAPDPVLVAEGWVVLCSGGFARLVWFDDAAVMYEHVDNPARFKAIAPARP